MRLTCIWKVINRDPNLETSENCGNVVEILSNDTQENLELVGLGSTTN